MAFTDRTAAKNFIKGALKVAGLTAAFDAVDQQNEETFVFASIAAADFAEQAIAMTKACKVKSVRITSATTLAASGSNYFTITVAKRDGAGGGATSIATSATDVAGGALTAFTPKTATVITAASANVLAAGNVLTCKGVDAGTTTEPLYTVAVTVEYI